jgi:hypothetical protein
MIETDLYFGQSKPGGGMVAEEEWKKFKEDHIARIFKEGSTTYEAAGHWYDPETHKLITEPTFVVIYFHKKSPLLSKQIDSLTELYKTTFQQQSVLRVDKKVRVKF